MNYRKPKRIFEDSGFVNPEKAYYVPLENVTNTKKQDIKTMIDEGRYFSIFAPRQSGKTTFLKGMCRELHKNPVYVAVMLSFQTYKNLDVPEFYSQLQKRLYSQLIHRLEEVNCEKAEQVKNFLENHPLVNHSSFFELFEQLNRIIQFKKIVIFIDEFDGIPLDELENFLHTLRELYQSYKDVSQKTLYSVGLIGIRNITKLIVGGVSPFNIADQVDLPSFSLNNVRELYNQYTTETNQPFTEDSVTEIYRETGGQPWLVNRLGTLLTTTVKPGTVEAIDIKDIEEAIESLLSERNAHFDNLYEKAKYYKETFLKVLLNRLRYNPDNEEQAFLEQYGLITRDKKKAIVSNGIYKKRYLTSFSEELELIAEMLPTESTAKSLLEFAETWKGYDLEKCLGEVYKTRT